LTVNRERAARRDTTRHVSRFVVVGAVGIAIQLLSLHFYTKVVGLHYLVATVAAVETTLLHNFVWHRLWTWSDRIGGGGYETLMMLARYNLTTGFVSVCGNVLAMQLLVGRARLPVVVANLITIGICSAANFFLADRVVFPRRRTAEVPVV
jgi:putative flippase GtrA